MLFGDILAANARANSAFNNEVSTPLPFISFLITHSHSILSPYPLSSPLSILSILSRSLQDPQ